MSSILSINAFYTVFCAVLTFIASILQSEKHIFEPGNFQALQVQMHIIQIFGGTYGNHQPSSDTLCKISIRKVERLKKRHLY